VDAVAVDRRRAHGFLLGFSFFVGVVLSIVALGVAASFIGRLLADWSIGFAIATAVVSFSAGFAAVFAPLIRQRFRSPDIERRGGLTGAFLYGLAYTLATVTTGAGPLFLLLTITAAIGRPAYGGMLSLAYGIGRGLPFLLLGIFAGAVGSWLARVERLRRGAELVSGIALVVIGGYFAWLAYALTTS
jgi:cytochrome c-type biogenesis protein